MKRFFAALILTACAVIPSRATLVDVGLVSYDQFIPADTGPGVNAFDALNLTGAFALPPDAPVDTPLTFENLTLDLEDSGGGTTTYSLGNLDPGVLLDVNGNPVVQVPDNSTFVSATLTGTISPASFVLNGSTVTVSPLNFTATILPSSGLALQVGDSANILINVEPASTAVPEPATFVCFGLGLLLLAVGLRRNSMAHSLRSRLRFSVKLRKTAVLLVSTVVAQGAVTLTSVPAPSAAQPGVTTVTLTGNGFPSGTILPSGVTVSITPVSSGPAMIATVQSVTTVAGAMRRVAFNFTGANVASPTAYAVRISGATTTNVSFASGNAAQLTVNPPAAITLAPGSGTLGATVNVGITGTYTNFLSGSTQVSFGSGITVRSFSVTSPTAASASIAIAANATPGANPVTVATGVQKATANFSIQSNVSAPVANAGPNSPAFYNALFQLDGSGSSDPANRPLTYSWMLLNKPQGSNSTVINPVSVKPTLPLDKYGSYLVQLTVNNGVLSSNVSQITITVPQNGAPTLNAIPTQTVTLGTTMNLRLTATDPDPQDTLTYYIDSAPQGAAFKPSPVIQWKPASTGPYSFSVHVADNANHMDSKSFLVNVVTGNQPPKLGALSDVTIPLGTQFQQTLTATANPGDTLTYSLLTGPAGMTLNGSTLHWTPTDVSQVGAAVVKVQVKNSENQADEGEFHISVTAVLAPIAQNDHYGVTLNKTLSVPAAGVLSNDISPNNTPLSAMLVSGPDKGTLSSFNADGSFSYTAPANYPGPTFSPTLKYDAVSNVSGDKPPLIVDVNKDGKLDMVAFTYASGLTSDVYGINGVDGSVLWTAPQSGGYALPVFSGSDCTSWDNGVASSAGNLAAAADMDGDGYPEIVFPTACARDTSDGGFHGLDAQERYIALSGRDGTVKWVSDALGTRTRATAGSDSLTPGAAGGTSATIAVLQQGETPSLVVAGASSGSCDGIVSGAPSDQRCRYVVILDGTTGKVRRKMYSLATSLATLVESVYNPLRYPAAIVYDLKGNGHLEIVAGGTVFDAQSGAVLWENPNPILGTAIANLDGGQDVEAIMVEAGSNDYIHAVSAYKSDGTLLWSMPIPTTTVCGSPTVADVNRDGFPEVMISVFNQLWVISHDGQLLWTSNIPSNDYVDDGFRATAYDLDNTGVPKVLLQSREALYFLNGTNGNIEYSIATPSFAPLSPAWPTVADLGSDGHAKVIFQTAPGNGSPGGYFVYQGQNNDWRPVRNIRAQWADYGANINEDGTIPFPQANVFGDPRTNVFESPAEWPYASGFVGVTQTQFTYKASASGLQSEPATVTIDLSPDNRPPQFTSIPPTRFDINSGFSYQAVAVDPDLGDTVTYSLSLNDPGNCSIDANSGLLTCTQNGNPWRRVIIVATDNHGANAFQTLSMLPSTPGTVPSVVGQTIDSAIAAITTAGYNVGTSTQIYSSQPAGTVLSQSPSGGASVLQGERIQLTVSQGPAPVVVPDVVGESVGQANTALSAVGFTPVATMLFSNTIPAGQVINQSPAAGTLISPGAENLTVSAGNGLYLKLASNATSADTPLAFTVTAYDLNGNTTAAPPLEYTITPRYQPYAGSLPAVNGNTIVPALNTLGAFTLTATDPATGRSVSSYFGVAYPHHPGLPSMIDDYAALMQAIADVNDYIRQLKVALAANDTAQMTTLIQQMVARWKQVDIQALRFDNPMAVAQGFPPTAADLPGLGLAPSADDILYSNLVDDADAKLQAWIAGLKAPNTSMADLAQLADNFNAAAAKIQGLQITEWGGVNAQSTMTAILSQHIPQLYDALMNEMAQAAAGGGQSNNNAMIQKIAWRRMAGRRSGVHFRRASTLAEISVTAATQFIVDKASDYFSQTFSNAKQFATDILSQAMFAAAATALAQHLRADLNGQDAATVAGASLSFHEFNSAPSFIECDCDIKHPDNNQVFLIGPDIVQPVTQLITTIQSAVNFGKAAGSGSAKNFDEVKKAFGDFTGELSKLQASFVSAEKAYQPTTEALNGCVILGGSCGELIYENGLTSVYTYTPPDGFTSLSGLPVPIIVVVYDSATGTAFFDTPVFFPTKQ